MAAVKLERSVLGQFSTHEYQYGIHTAVRKLQCSSVYVLWTSLKSHRRVFSATSSAVPSTWCIATQQLSPTTKPSFVCIVTMRLLSGDRIRVISQRQEIRLAGAVTASLPEIFRVRSSIRCLGVARPPTVLPVYLDHTKHRIKVKIIVMRFPRR